MATPNSPTQQRYSAGSCRLEVTLQLSALSQWYSQPVAENLSFQLWLQLSTTTLVAQGDRATLQAITDYIQQKTQRTLAIAQLSRLATLSAIADEPLIQPASLQLQQPLSYLQLCDLSTVLSQYQQVTKTLPVALSPSAASPLSALRSQSLSNQIIPFPLNRRAGRSTRLSRSKIWASSAAAAVFAVGLTATLWPNISSQVAQTEADSTLIEPIEPNSALEPEFSAPTGRTITPALESDPGDRLVTRSADGSQSAANPDAAPTAPNSDAASDVPVLPSNDAANRTASGELTPSRPADPVPPAPPQSAKAPAAENLPTVTTEPETAQSSAPFSAQSSDDLADAANAESSENAAASSAARLAIPPSTANVITQVQSYFQVQWQAVRAADRQALQVPLAYRLQLSETGAIMSFTALNDQSQVWRDRLLPTSNPPTFDTMTTDSAQPDGSAIVLRLTVTTDGQVQVSEF